MTIVARLIAVPALFAVLLGAAQACEHRFRVTLADGSQLCLDEHPLGRVEGPNGLPLSRRLPNDGVYAIHVARGRGCRADPQFFVPSYAGINRRLWLAQAKSECEQRAGEQGSGGCQCQRLVVNQQSTLGRPQFDQWSTALGSPQRSAPPRR